MTICKRKEWKHFRYMTIFYKRLHFPNAMLPCISFRSHVPGPASRVDPSRPINYNTGGIWNLNKLKPSHLAILRPLSFGVFNSHTACVSGVIKMNTTCTIIKMRNIMFGNKINKTKLISNVDLHWNAGQTELKQCDYMIQGDHEAVSLKHRPWNITASTPNAIVNYLCWAQFSLRFWHIWWVSSLFQWLPTISKPVSSISLIVGRIYIRISLTTRENTLVARDGEGFKEVAMLLHVLMFWGLLARPAGRSSRSGLASGKLPSAHIASYEKGRCCQAPPCGETGVTP